MKKYIVILAAATLLGGGAFAQQKAAKAEIKTQTATYANNRYPLVQKPYIELPLGSIRAKGWLKEMLIRQKEGATGQMDQLYPQVMGSRNGWLGGDGDQWERGPYWVDGLVPLAYILDDKELKAKAQPWIEWALQSQREDGFFGPAKDYPGEPGLQRNNSHDWWPRMVVLKILQQYYSATQDERVISLMTNYFRYQLKTLPETPLGHYSFWAEFRACDNLQVVYWLYNITGDAFLLDLSELLHKQSFSFADMLQRGDLRRINTIHCVNLAQGIKEPVIYYQQSKDKRYTETVKEAFREIREFHGQPQGMYGGDEALHGNNPTQGSELCSAVELMYSLEKMMEITGDTDFADHLERVAFNALPTQVSDDFMAKQYFQQPNQVMISRHRRNFDQDHAGTDNVYGTLSGYPCCFSNMHQGWPKFTQSLWYATPGNGLAVLAYSPSEVTARVGDGYTATISEETSYPMDDRISFTINDLRNAKKKESSARFPLQFRIPGWCSQADITVNGTAVQVAAGDRIVTIDRNWGKGDHIEIHLPMEVSADTWYENSVAIERGPLVYALKMQEKWTETQVKEPGFGTHYYNVSSDTPWNYGLVHFDRNKAAENATVKINKEKLGALYPWNIENAPIEIKMKARRIPSWGMYNEMAGPQPYSFCSGGEGPVEEITLIPYGCTTLRITEFPMVRK